jgi:FixJ family two-component response regulator
MMHDPTVFVVDDDPDVRESLCYLIDSIGLPAQAYESAQDFLEAYDPNRPGCLVLDVRLHGMSGLDLQEQLTAWGAPLPVIIITGYADVSTAVRSFKGGALEFIEKPFSDQVLLDRIQRAIETDREKRERARRRATLDRRLARLTPREQEVLDLLVDGKTTKVIADQLGLSVRTIEIHRGHIHQKMEVDSVISLVRLVLQAA